jgi:N-acetylneuraminic acid mutarotase
MLRILTIVLGLVVSQFGSAHAEGRWESAARMDAPRAGLAVAVLEGRLYAAGGAGLTDPRDEFEVYDAELDRWFSETPLPRGLERFGMAALDGRIYAAGGYAPGEQGVGPTASMWSWSPEGGVWQSEAAMPAPKADFELINLGDRLYAIGNTRDDGEIFVFDPEDKSWETLEVGPGITRRGAAALAVDDEIYVIGGMADGAAFARVDIFTPASGEWRAGPALPEGRSGMAAAYYHDRVHVFGGRGEDQRTTLSQHSSIAAGETEWLAEADLSSPRTAADAAALDAGIFLVGGGSGGGFFAPFTALDVTDVFVDEAS